MMLLSRFKSFLRSHSILIKINNDFNGLCLLSRDPVGACMIPQDLVHSRLGFHRIFRKPRISILIAQMGTCIIVN